MHWYYEISMMGYKYNMNDLAAAVGLAQLKKLDEMNDKRRKCVARYINGIKHLHKIKPLLPYDPKYNNYWIFGVRCKQRDDLIIHLKLKGVATGVHYLPLLLHPYFKSYANRCKIAINVWKTFVTLPLHSDLQDEEVDYVIEALAEFDKK